ncbi:MAG: T9SS type A sorting domain-containing protein, partial [candidate division WOR-3 bacterium]|nr:T9SS type A sorting domain-containing protein [candidate division WOR-3 bacterium]
PGQSYYNPYPTCGNTRDWVYGYNHYINGLSSLFYGAEIGTAFYEPVANLDFISRQVFKAAKYLAGFSDSLILVAEARVPPPRIHPLDTVPLNFTIAWQPKNTYDNHPIQWELVRLSNPSIKTDSLESGTSRWILQGYSISTAQSHSPTRSLWSGNTANMNSAATTVHPYLVQPGDSFTFWCYYNLQNNYDVTVVEVSENTKEWFNLDTMRFTGTQTSWIRKAYSLTPWVGKSVYFRFRTMYDGSIQSGGFYVDDISPVCLFNNVNVISNSIPDTLYTFSNHPLGEYYYYVRGYNTWGWGDYSCLEKVFVRNVGIEAKCENNLTNSLSFAVLPNPFQGRCLIKIQIPDQAGQNFNLEIFDVSGRIVKSFNPRIQNQETFIIWDAKDDAGFRLPSGIYFIKLETGNLMMVEKVVLLQD